MKIILISISIVTLFISDGFSEIDNRKEFKKLQEEADNQYAVDKWHPNSYFLIGAGYSVIRALTHYDNNKSVAGAHFTTSVGHWAFDAVGFEAGANINFAYFQDMTLTNYIEQTDGSFKESKLEGFNAKMWDTTFFWGIMARFPISYRSDNINVYLKFFQGYGTSVYWVSNDNNISDSNATRFYSEGILFGFSIGNIFNAFNKNNVWFVQISIYIKMYEETLALKDGGILPETLESQKVTNNYHLLKALLTFGFRLY